MTAPFFIICRKTTDVNVAHILYDFIVKLISQ